MKHTDDASNTFSKYSTLKGRKIKNFNQKLSKFLEKFLERVYQKICKNFSTLANNVKNEIICSCIV